MTTYSIKCKECNYTAHYQVPSFLDLSHCVTLYFFFTHSLWKHPKAALKNIKGVLLAILYALAEIVWSVIKCVLWCVWKPLDYLF